MPRTNHSTAISQLRDVADTFDRLYTVVGRPQYKADSVSCRAAADLLEMHDATGINLYNAPNLLIFVDEVCSQMIGRVPIQDNHA